MSTERLIYSLGNLEKTLDELNTYYKNFHEVIANEQIAIEASNLDEIEQILPQKVSLGDHIESSIHQVSSIFQTIVESISSISSISTTEMSLSNISQKLDSIVIELGEQNLETRVLKHNISKLKDKIASMQELHKDLYPKIEANKYLVDTLLDNHRQTHRFWLGMISESQGTYGAHGSHNKQNLTSMISVKA